MRNTAFETIEASDVLSCALLESVDAGAPESIVFMPAGNHEISATVNGKPAKRKVTVDASAANLFQKDLTNSKGSRRYIDFDHRRGKAAAIPKQFRWEEGKGVVLDIEWTQAGKSAIEGKDYSYFSPSFVRDPKTGKPAGLYQKSIGGLVNEPAFQALESIAAKEADDPETPTKKPNMEELVDAGLITTAEAKADNVGSIVAGKVKDILEQLDASKKEVANANAANKRANDEIKELKDKIEAADKAAIERDVQEAIDAGKIDEKSKDFWIDSMQRNPEGTRKELELREKKAPESVFAKKTSTPKKETPKDSKFKDADEFMDAMNELVRGDKFETVTAAMEAHPEDYERFMYADQEEVS